MALRRSHGLPQPGRPHHAPTTSSFVLTPGRRDPSRSRPSSASRPAAPLPKFTLSQLTTMMRDTPRVPRSAPAQRSASRHISGENPASPSLSRLPPPPPTPLASSARPSPRLQLPITRLSSSFRSGSPSRERHRSASSPPPPLPAPPSRRLSPVSSANTFSFERQAPEQDWERQLDCKARAEETTPLTFLFRLDPLHPEIRTESDTLTKGQDSVLATPSTAQTHNLPSNPLSRHPPDPATMKAQRIIRARAQKRRIVPGGLTEKAMSALQHARSRHIFWSTEQHTSSFPRIQSKAPPSIFDSALAAAPRVTQTQPGKRAAPAASLVRVQTAISVTEQSGAILARCSSSTGSQAPILVLFSPILSHAPSSGRVDVPPGPMRSALVALACTKQPVLSIWDPVAIPLSDPRVPEEEVLLCTRFALYQDEHDTRA